MLAERNTLKKALWKEFLEKRLKKIVKVVLKSMPSKKGTFKKSFSINNSKNKELTFKKNISIEDSKDFEKNTF